MGKGDLSVDKSEMKARYTAARQEIDAKRQLDAGKSYASGAAIMLFYDNPIFNAAAFCAKFFLLVFGIFAVFYLTTQI